MTLIYHSSSQPVLISILRLAESQTPTWKIKKFKRVARRKNLPKNQHHQTTSFGKAETQKKHAHTHIHKRTLPGSEVAVFFCFAFFLTLSHRFTASRGKRTPAGAFFEKVSALERKRPAACGCCKTMPTKGSVEENTLEHAV